MYCLESVETETDTARKKVNAEYKKLSTQEKKLFDEYRDLKEKAKTMSNAPLQEQLAFDNEIDKIKSKLPQNIRSAFSDLEMAQGRLSFEKRRFQQNNQSAPTPHDIDAIIIFGGKSYPMSAKISVDNASKNTDNTRKINDYLSIRSDGHFDVKLLHEKPSVGEETERERIERRKKEIANMDKLLEVRVNPDAYAQLLSDKAASVIEKEFQRLDSWEKLEQEYRLRYNSVLAKYSEATPEEKVIGGLFNLKGAIRYAERQGNISGRNQLAVENRFDSGRNLRDVGQASARETGTGNRLNAKHSEKQGAFSVEDKVKAALANDKSVEVLIKNLGGKIVDDELVADDETKAKIDKALDDSGKVKYSIAWHGTPHDFDSFTLQAIGTGEGAQVHGWGLYFAGDRKVSEGYKERLGKGVGRLFKVDIPDREFLLDEQKVLAKQSERVQVAINNVFNELGLPYIDKSKPKNKQSYKTLTGKEIYRKIAENLGSDKAASELLNKYGVKGIAYKGELDGKCYVVFDDAAIKILKKYSLQGAGDTTIGNFVADENLTSQQKLLKDFSKQMGMTLQFFKNDNKDFHGAYVGGVTYLNTNSKTSLGKVFWHETLHWLKSNNESLYNQLAKAANLTQEQLTNYLDTTGRQDLKTNAEITEEILADSLHKVLARVKDKNVLEKVVAWIQNALQKFKDMFRNKQGGLATAQYNNIADTFGRIARDLKDENGNKIFRFNRNTRQLELANGGQLADLAKVANKKTIDNEADMNENIENEIFDEQFKNRPKIKENVQSVISKAIGEMDLSKIKSVAKLRDTRDSLDYFTKLNANYHLKKSTGKAEDAKKIAVWLEYARRCFDNDRRITRLVALQMGDYGQQGRVHQVGENVRPELDNGAIKRKLRESHGRIQRYVTAEHIDAHNEFLRLYNEKAIARGDAEVKIYPREGQDKHSVKGAFSLDNQTVAKNLGGRFENGEWIFDDDKSKRAFEKHLQNVKNNFEGTKFSVYDSVHNYFNEKAERLSENLGLKGKNIVTDAMEEYNLEQQREKAMQDYIDDPSDANKQRLKDLKVTKSRLEAYKQGKEYDLEIGALEGNFASPNRIAAKNPIFNYFYQLGRKAMDTLVKKRDTWSKRLENVWELVKDKQSKQDLTDLLIFGDMNQVEYGTLTDAEKSALPKDNYNAAYTQAQINKIMAETDVSENVAKAYLQVRKLLRAVHEQLDNAKRKPRQHSRHLTDKEIEKLRDNKFVLQETIKIDNKRDEQGRRLVNYTEFVNREQVYTKITKDALDKMKADKVIQVLKEKEVGEVNGEKIFDVRVREGVAPVGNLKGYFPHCFYEYMIRIKDKDGKIVEDYGKGGVIDSGRTQREAVKLAEDWQKTFTLKEGEYIYIAPKTMNFDKLGMSEKDYAPMMGDKDFDTMTHKIAENHEMKLKDAKELVKGSVRFKNRHRFFGHLQERKGAKGYSTDIEYCLRHYTNQSARYIALETEFKPQAISTFERTFGRFDNDYRNNDNAQYCKEFIEDVNGTPTHLEKQLDKLLAKSGFYRNWLVPAFGERAALTLANKTVDLTSKLTLGMCNISSALLNLTQLINAGGYLGGYGRLSKQLNKLFKNRGKLSRAEIKILNETGVLSDIGLDTATGYDRNRFFNNESTEEGWLGAVENLFNKANWLLDKGMYPFQAVDKLSRIATTLAAYEQAKAKGKTHTEAIEYASELNTKANFEYGVNDAPNIFRRSSVIGKILLQFQKFPIKQLEIMRDMWFTSNKTTRAQKLAFWLPYIAMVGLMGLIPAFDWIDDFIYKMTDWSPKDWVSKGIMKHTPKPVGKFLLYGGGSVLNVDTSKRAGLSDIMPQSLPDFLLGATGSKIVDFTKNMIRGFTVGEEGAYLNALRNVSPGLYNIYAAFEGEMLGNRNRRMSIYETLYDRLIRGIGFKSVDESMAADIKRIISHDRSILNKEKQKAVDAFIENPSAENLKRLKELEIKPATVKKERERKKLDKLGRIDYDETKKERQQNQYLFDFAK